MAIELISKIKPKNNGSFPMVDAVDVEMPDGTRLKDFVDVVAYALKFVAVTQGKYDDLVASDSIEPDRVYLIVSDTA